MATTKIPYIVSFMIRKDGCLIDGTSICDAINIIDKAVNRQPICYITNCVHPTNLKLALTNDKNFNHTALNRFKGIEANASILSPEELNNCGILQQNDFNTMIDEMLILYKQFNLKIFGGCCGTNDVFIDHLANSLISI
jgi:S-methylmethionine-dependent homocysteine/selenocysteine methylase